jgi:hypothetical protein
MHRLDGALVPLDLLVSNLSCEFTSSSSSSYSSSFENITKRFDFYFVLKKQDTKNSFDFE